MIPIDHSVSQPVRDLYQGTSSLSPYLNPGYRVARQAQLADQIAQYNLDAARQSLRGKTSRYQDKPGEWIGAQGSGVDSLTQKFLGAWQKEMGQTRNIFNTAVQGILDSQKGLKEVDYVDDLKQLYGQVMTDYGEYKRTYAPLRREALAAAKRSLARKTADIDRLRDASEYNEGDARSRAIGDVARRQAVERDARERYLEGLGIDPSSGRFLDYVRGSGQQNALSQVWAGNEAERLAKEQHKQDLARIAGLEDPSIAANIAAQIAAGEQGYRSSGADIASQIANMHQKTMAMRQSGALALGQLAQGYGQTMAQPYGSLGSTLLGLSLSKNQQQPMSLAQSYMQQQSSPGLQANWPTVRTVGAPSSSNDRKPPVPLTPVNNIPKPPSSILG